MRVVVVGDLPHVVIDVVLYGQLFDGDLGQPIVHVPKCLRGRRSSVVPPHNHRDMTDLAVGDPAHVIRVEPLRAAISLAQLAGLPR